jgi:hypothetical protein
VGGQGIDLRLAEILASQEHVLVERHGNFLSSRPIAG